MFKLSSEAALYGAITVETKFIVDYLPYADGDYVKVYLYGLSLASRKADSDDTVERLTRRLNLDEATVNAAIDYWTEQGLMARLGDEITYLSIRNARPKIKKYDVDKYAEFNRQVQRFITARQITPNEYNEYYALMEKLDYEWQAMVLTVKYCVDMKGENVSCPYILSVARNLAQDGYRTHTDVENRLEEYGVYYNDLCRVLAAMGSKRPDHESFGLYKKWLREYHLDKSVILGVAQTVKKGGMATLDYMLTGYVELGLTTLDRIDKYETERRELLKLAKTVNKTLGVRYENVEPEIVKYIRPWLDLGFEPDALVCIADYCMQNNLKTLSDLDAVVREFMSDGVFTVADVRSRVGKEERYDTKIEKIKSALGIKGAVSSSYRAFYTAWTETRAMPHEVIEYAASLCPGKTFAYLNAIIVAWSDAGINTLEKAKTQNVKVKESAATAKVTEKYSAEELNALFTRIGGDNE